MDTTEMKLFRSLVVNAVLATDTDDKDLASARDKRWQKLFGKQKSLLKNEHPEVVNRKATLCIELLLQASDNAHYLQHWQLYYKFSERQYFERYLAFRAGRDKQDPKETWFAEQVKYFLCQIIPLAKKLNACGIFGSTSFEFLASATKNLSEWESTGEATVEQWAQRAKMLVGD